MIDPEKIEEWIQEARERPESAAVIIQYIANRLRDLSSRNEALLTENIALTSGKRVEEYERRIAHLEYQLELLKRQYGGDLSSVEIPMASKASIIEPACLLIYDALGHLICAELNPTTMTDGAIVGRLHGEFAQGGEPPRLMVVPATEELLFVFTSGRVAVHSAASLPEASGDISWEWEKAPIPEAPRGGERLACLAPISNLALAEFFLQTSRRGYIKKIMASMAQSILVNHYIGVGTILPVDRTFEITLCGKDERLVLLSREGYSMCVEVKGLPFSVEEVMRLEATDHLITVCINRPGKALLVMTQIGKVVQIQDEEMEPASSLHTKGKPVFSRQRRESGVRVVGVAQVSEEDWGVALHGDGHITAHGVSVLLGKGILPTQNEILTFTAFGR